MLEAFGRVAESVAYGSPTIPLVSNVSGRLADAEVSTAGYWVRHVREAVRFADGVRALEAAGARAYVEIGPRATLLGLASGSLPGEALLLPSIQPGRVESETMLEALGVLYVHGQSIDRRLFPEGAPRVELPLMAWQRERYWRESPAGDSGEDARRHAGLHPAAGLVAHEVAAETAQEGDDRLLSLEWESSPLPAPRAALGRWLLMGERSSFGEALGASLEAAGQAVVLAAGDATMGGARARLGGAFGGDHADRDRPPAQPRRRGRAGSDRGRDRPGLRQRPGRGAGHRRDGVAGRAPAVDRDARGAGGAGRRCEHRAVDVARARARRRHGAPGAPLLSDRPRSRARGWGG